MIDLHVHTTASDGTDSPEEVVKKAEELGLTAIAITDHDTASGAAAALEICDKYNVEVVAGIEISAEFEGTEVHILGYLIDPHSRALKPVLDWVVNDRNERNRKIVGMLEADGYDISLKGLEEKHPGTVLGRPHIAGWLMEKGYVSSIQQAFDEFLADGKKYFLPRTYLPLDEAVKAIKNAGGVAVAAHLLQYKFNDEKLRDFLRTAKAAGVIGMETTYSLYSQEETRYLENIAEELSLIKTGGSDYHGSRKPNIMLGIGTGSMAVSDGYLDEIKAAKRGYKR